MVCGAKKVPGIAISQTRVSSVETDLFTASLGAFPFVFSSRPTYDTPTLRHHRRRRRCQTGRRLVQEGARLKLDPFHSFFFSTLVSRCVRASLVLCFYSIALCGVCVVCVVAVVWPKFAFSPFFLYHAFLFYLYVWLVLSFGSLPPLYVSTTARAPFFLLPVTKAWWVVCVSLAVCLNMCWWDVRTTPFLSSYLHLHCLPLP